MEKIESLLGIRPSMDEYKEKIDLIDELNDKLTLSETENLAFKLELTNNKTKIESLQQELEMAKQQPPPPPPQSPQQESSTKNDAVVQTEIEAILQTQPETALPCDASSLPKENVPSSSIPPQSQQQPSTLDLVPVDGAAGSGVEDISVSVSCATIDDDTISRDVSLITQELKLIHHPDVQREEELVLFKEKYTKLVEEKLLIDKELESLREDYQQYRNKSLTHLLMYLAPIFALIAYLFIHYCN